MANIYIFGASGVCGAWDKEGGWADRLKRYIFTKNIESGFVTEHMVYNLGVDGDDSKGLLSRIENDFIIRKWEGSENIFIITIGTNDTIYSLSDKTTRVSPNDYERNLNKIIEIFKKYSTKIVFFAPLPIEQSLVNPIPWLEGHSYRSEYIEQYKDIMEEVAKQEKIYWFDLYDKLNNSEWKKKLADGVHENTEAHEYIFIQLKDFLIENKII